MFSLSFTCLPSPPHVHPSAAQLGMKLPLRFQQWCGMFVIWLLLLGGHPTTTGVEASRLFFSEYIQRYDSAGSIDGVAIEIYNPGCYAVDLAEYMIVLELLDKGGTAYTGGMWSDSVITWSSGTMLNSGTAHSICDQSNSFTRCNSFASLLSKQDGTRAMGLFHNQILIDIIGRLHRGQGLQGSSTIYAPFQVGLRVDQDVPCQWSTCNDGYWNAPWMVANVSQATRNHRLIRKSTVSEGTIDFLNTGDRSIWNPIAAEWTVDTRIEADTPSLGGHQCDFQCSPTLALISCGTLGSSYTLYLQHSQLLQFGSPLVQVVCPDNCMFVPRYKDSTTPLLGAPFQGTRDVPDPMVVRESQAVAGLFDVESNVCAAAIRAGQLPMTYDTIPSLPSLDSGFTSTSPFRAYSSGTTGATYTPDSGACLRDSIRKSGAYQVQSTYTAASHSQRARGRPHLLLSYTGVSAAPFRSDTHQCVLSTASSPSRNGTDFGGLVSFNTSLVNVTRCLNDCNAPDNGQCNEATGLCKCWDNYQGQGCDSKLCNPPCYNGNCRSSDGICECLPGFSGPQCLSRDCSAYNYCNGHGVCDSSVGSCVCDGGWSGVTCEQRTCINQCSGRGICDTTLGKCTCYGNYIGEDCSLIPCLEGCSGIGTCDYTTGYCMCHHNNGTTSACRTAPCTNNCSGTQAGVCNVFTQVCTCNEGYVGSDCSRKIEHRT